jgi:predicted Zn-dependent protease
MVGLGAPALAQDAPYLPYYSADTTRVHALAVAHRNALKAHFGVPKTGNGEYREHYKRLAQEASTDVYNSVRYGALLDPVLLPYVQRVFQAIKQANPQLPASARVVLTKNPEPNAHALGDGTVVVNVGLLPRLENESQLAFILCHELAHVQARHMERGLQESLTALHSKEMRREYRRIINEQYNISSKIKALALGFSLNASYHRRSFEKQADSLGYALLQRTPYEAPQAYRVLQLLDKIDEPEVNEPVALSQFFSCAEFPHTFQTAPAAPKSIFTVKTEKTVLETTDTLKSHPDCGKRMRYVRELARARWPKARRPPPASLPASGRQAAWKWCKAGLTTSATTVPCLRHCSSCGPSPSSPTCATWWC